MFGYLLPQVNQIMRFSIITPNFNGAAYLSQTIDSVLAQRKEVDLEYIIIDGGSTDGSLEIIDRYRSEFSHCIVESDEGPADAINMGLALACGDVVAWLNADDIYFPAALARVRDSFDVSPKAAMCFGGCLIIDEKGEEIRIAITRFKELFYPLSSSFTYQCINYISHPALFFRTGAVKKVGPLRQDMVAAWDYEFILRLWNEGNACRVKGAPLSAFRWYDQSISGENFHLQFKEEYEVARDYAGFSLQTGLHFLVRWSIVGIYSAMSLVRSRSRQP